jgi:hypothetical protein
LNLNIQISKNAIYASTPRKLMKPCVWPSFKVPYLLKFEWYLSAPCPWYPPHKKSLIRALSHTDKMESPFFVAAHKNIVAKVVGNGDMQNLTKYRAKI